MTTAAQTCATQARGFILNAELRSQRRALERKHAELATCDDLGLRRALKQSIKWHEETIERLVDKLAVAA